MYTRQIYTPCIYINIWIAPHWSQTALTWTKSLTLLSSLTDQDEDPLVRICVYICLYVQMYKVDPGSSCAHPVCPGAAPGSQSPHLLVFRHISLRVHIPTPAVQTILYSYAHTHTHTTSLVPSFQLLPWYWPLRYTTRLPGYFTYSLASPACSSLVIMHSDNHTRSTCWQNWNTAPHSPNYLLAFDFTKSSLSSPCPYANGPSNLWSDSSCYTQTPVHICAHTEYRAPTQERR